MQYRVFFLRDLNMDNSQAKGRTNGAINDNTIGKCVHNNTSLLLNANKNMTLKTSMLYSSGEIISHFSKRFFFYSNYLQRTQ